MSRSEEMKRYWSIVKDVSTRTGQSIRNVRRDFKGKPFPDEIRTHYIPVPYQVDVYSKDKKMHATVSSNRPLTKEEIRKEAAEISWLHKGEYDGQFYNEEDISIGRTYIDPNQFPELEEIEEEVAYDFGSEGDFFGK